MISHFFEERYLWRSYCSRQPSLREVLSMLTVALILAAAFLAFGADWSTPLLQGMNSPRSALEAIMGGGASQEGVEIRPAHEAAASTAACPAVANLHKAHLIAIASASLPEEVRVAGAPCVRFLGVTVDPSRPGLWSVHYAITGGCADAAIPADVVGRFRCVATGRVEGGLAPAPWPLPAAATLAGRLEHTPCAPPPHVWECDGSVDGRPIPNAPR